MTGQWFSPGTPVSSTNKTDRNDITEILLKVALNTTNQTKPMALIQSGEPTVYRYFPKTWVNPHSDDWYNVLIVCEPTLR